MDMATTAGTELDTEATQEEYAPNPPVFGLPGNIFYVIHILALVCLITSLAVSGCVLAYLIYSKRVGVFQRPIGERLVIYLAVCDMFFSVSHSFDHSYMMAVLDNPPDGACMTFAFFLQLFTMTQALLVLFTAINAMSLVVLEKKIPLGTYDWRLLLYAIGVPAVIGFIGLSVPFLGPSGAWCFVDMRKSWGPLMTNVYGMAIVIVFAVNAVSYGAVWFKITQAARTNTAVAATGNTESRDKYHKTAKMMMLFVAVYLLQWWPYVVQAIWTTMGVPHLSFIILTVIFANLGGLFNFMAYTFIRKKYASVGSSDKDSDKMEKTKIAANTQSSSA